MSDTSITVIYHVMSVTLLYQYFVGINNWQYTRVCGCCTELRFIIIDRRQCYNPNEASSEKNGFLWG